jgi:hypothetical protein
VKVAPPISVDDQAVAVAEVETPLLESVLPTDNLFGLPGRIDSFIRRARLGHAPPTAHARDPYGRHRS